PRTRSAALPLGRQRSARRLQRADLAGILAHGRGGPAGPGGRRRAEDVGRGGVRGQESGAGSTDEKGPGSPGQRAGLSGGPLMSAPPSCPPPERLRQLLDDRLSPTEQAELTTHLSGCAHCQRQLETLAAGGAPTLPLPASLPPLEDSLVRVLEGLRSN